MSYYNYNNYNELGRVESGQFGSHTNLNNQHNDLFLMNLSMYRNDNGLFDLSKQPTTMSQIKNVGSFQISKTASINSIGDIIVNQKLDAYRQDNFENELEEIIYSKSKQASQQLFINNGIYVEPERNQINLNDYNLPVGMTCSQEVDASLQKQLMKNSYFQQPITNRVNYDDIHLDYSVSMRQQMNVYNSINLSQIQNEYLMRQTNNGQRNNIFQVSLIDKKMETFSEPDLEIKYYDSTPEQNQSQEKNEDNFGDSNSNNHSNSFSHLRQDQNLEVKIEPQVYEETSYQKPHSEDYSQQPTKRAPSKRKRISKPVQPNKSQRNSKYRQSRHKNVFKNFGGTLIRFIIYNQHFYERVLDLFKQDEQKKKGFQIWLQTSIKLERKKDFQIAWTTFKTDSDNIKEYKEILRELSRDFFENFSFIYLINSKKINDMEIHLRSIHTYLASINNPDCLERFKPI